MHNNGNCWKSRPTTGALEGNICTSKQKPSWVVFIAFTIPPIRGSCTNYNTNYSTQKQKIEKSMLWHCMHFGVMAFFHLHVQEIERQMG